MFSVIVAIIFLLVVAAIVIVSTYDFIIGAYHFMKDYVVADIKSILQKRF